MTDRLPTESSFQGDISKYFFFLINLFQLSIHLRTLHQISTRNTHVAENLYFRMQSTCPGLLTGENYIGLRTIIEACSKI